MTEIFRTEMFNFGARQIHSKSTYGDVLVSIDCKESFCGTHKIMIGVFIDLYFLVMGLFFFSQAGVVSRHPEAQWIPPQRLNKSFTDVDGPPPKPGCRDYIMRRILLHILSYFQLSSHVIMSSCHHR